MSEEEMRIRYPSASDEKKLVKKAQEGDDNAFTELKYIFNKTLIGFIKYKLRCSKEVSRIVAEKSWTKIQEKISTYDPAKDNERFCDWVIRNSSPELLEAIKKSEKNPKNELIKQLSIFREFLHIVCRCAGYPHEVLTLLLTKVIYGKSGSNEIENIVETIEQKLFWS